MQHTTGQQSCEAEACGQDIESQGRWSHEGEHGTEWCATGPGVLWWEEGRQGTSVSSSDTSDRLSSDSGRTSRVPPLTSSCGINTASAEA